MRLRERGRQSIWKKIKILHALCTEEKKRDVLLIDLASYRYCTAQVKRQKTSFCLRLLFWAWSKLLINLLSCICVCVLSQCSPADWTLGFLHHLSSALERKVKSQYKQNVLCWLISIHLCERNPQQSCTGSNCMVVFSTNKPVHSLITSFCWNLMLIEWMQNVENVFYCSWPCRRNVT